MKSLREDVLLYRLIQLSLFGSLLMIGILYLLQQCDIYIFDFTISDTRQEFLSQENKESWLSNSIHWLNENVVKPMSR